MTRISLSLPKASRLLTAVLLLTLGVTIATEPVAQALGNTSPDPNQMFSLNSNGDAVNDPSAATHIAHMLKYENVAHIKNLSAGIYYRTTSHDAYLNIRPEATLADCTVANVDNQFSNNSAYVQVTITGTTSVTYKIVMDKICEYKNSDGNIRNNVSNADSNCSVDGAPCWKKNKFYANYALPPNMMNNTGSDIYKYKYDLDIRYSAAVPEGNSEQQTFNFFLNVASGSAVIGPYGEQSVQSFGLRNSYYKHPEDRGDLIYMEFGFPCDVMPPDYGNVKLYDPDVGTFGDTYMWVEKDGAKLEKTDYYLGSSGPYQRQNVSWSTYNRWQSTGGSGVVSQVAIKDPEPGHQYFFVIKDALQSGYTRPNGNVVSISIPGDSVYGEGNCSFNLTPSVSLNPSDVAEAGQSVVISPSVNNTGKSVASSIGWQVVQFGLDPGDTVPNASGGVGTDAPCTYFGISSCAAVNSGTRDYGVGVTNMSNEGFAIPSDAKIGSKYCFALAVRPYRTAVDKWRYSAPQCVLIGVKPRVQVWGYDTMAGGLILTSLSKKANNTYGSWSEYAAFSNGLNTNFASAAGYAIGSPVPQQSGWSDLTGANTSIVAPCGGPTSFGCYGGVQYPVGLVTSLLAQCSNILTGDISTGGDYNNDKMICRNGTVTIDSNIENVSGATTSSSDIPQEVIIAKNIDIAANVKRVDAWLIAIPDMTDGGNTLGADGRISTCASISGYSMSGAALNASKCDNELKVNGPIIAKQLYLYRTHHVTGDPSIAAEIFDLRADAFLWAYQGVGTGKPIAQTTSVTELPPRF